MYKGYTKVILTIDVSSIFIFEPFTCFSLEPFGHKYSHLWSFVGRGRLYSTKDGKIYGLFLKLRFE